MICGRSKTECKTCRSNENGFCVSVKKPVADIVKKWENSQRYRANKKLKENSMFFDEDVYDDILHYLNIIEDNDPKSKEHIKAMNELSAIFSHWRRVDTDWC